MSVAEDAGASLAAKFEAVLPHLDERQRAGQCADAQEINRRKIRYPSRNVTTWIVPNLIYWHHARSTPVAE